MLDFLSSPPPSDERHSVLTGRERHKIEIIEEEPGILSRFKFKFNIVNVLLVLVGLAIGYFAQTSGMNILLPSLIITLVLLYLG